VNQNPLVVDIDQARAAINHAEENMRQATAAWAEKEARYRWVCRELAYRLTIGNEEMVTVNLCRMVGMDEELVQEVLAEHKDRNAKAAMRA